MKWLDWNVEHSLELPECGGYSRQVHVFDEASKLAINMAIASKRPLLLRGEPGTGKSQLARAAAVAMKRAFVTKVVDAATQVRDLFWTIDSVERLAEAQVLGAVAKALPEVPSKKGEACQRDVLDRIAVVNFVRPGPLWWAFDWESAKSVPKHQEPPPVAPSCTAAKGVVLLIDEIDKADTEIPNGLLEALGSGRFVRPDRQEAIEMKLEPLVIITTNEERALPDAFLRRCLVLHLGLPEEREKLIDHLVTRGAVHFPEVSEEIRKSTAELLVEDRITIRERGLMPPGQAEYLDLLRALDEQARGDEIRQQELLGLLRVFAFRKHPAETDR